MIDYYHDGVEDSQNNMPTSKLAETSYALTTAQHYTIDQQIAYMNIDVFEEQWGTTGYGRKIGVIDNGNPDTSRYSGTTTTAGYYHIYVVQETLAADGSNRIGTPQAVAILQY